MAPSACVGANSLANVNFTRVRANRTISGYIYVAGRFYDPAVDGPLTASNGAQSVQAIKPIIQDPPLLSTPSWSLTEPDDTVGQHHRHRRQSRLYDHRQRLRPPSHHE